MLLGLEILVATYIGTKLYDKIKKSKPKKIDLINSKSDTPWKSLQAHTPPDRQAKTYLKTSTVAVGLTVVGYWYPVLIPVGVAVLSYASIPILRETEKNLRSHNAKINNNLLNSIVTVGCIATGSYIIGSVMMWFMYLADLMVFNIRDNTKALLTRHFEQAIQQKVWLIKDGIEHQVLLETVQPGNILIINTGEVIAVDGVITEGMAMIDQHTLTGESAPVEKITGDQVFASTLTVSGKILVRVEKQGTETAIAKIMHILLHTTDFKMSLQTKGEQWADKMAMPLLLIGGGLSPIIGIMPAMTVLYSGPGNMLKTFISLQLLSHMTLFSRHGILVKDGRTLEIMPKVDTILFDKTGTLTQEKPEVGEIFTFTEQDADTILRYAAIAEQRLAHPIAQAILHHAQQRGLLNETVSLDAADYQVGYGITVTFENHIIQVGSLRFMALQNIAVPKEIKLVQQSLQEQGSSLVAVGIDGVLAGALEIAARIRPEARDTIQALRQRGVNYMAIVSGDHEQPTRRLAEYLGMDAYFYDVLPQDKAAIVKKLQTEGRTVCFIGDGVNDAIAIKKAQVSISLNGATTVATDLAQVVLMDDNLSHLPVLFEISQQLRQRSLQSLGICCTYGITTFTAGAVFHIGLLFPMTVGTMNYMAGLAHGAMPLLSLPRER